LNDPGMNQLYNVNPRLPGYRVVQLHGSATKKKRSLLTMPKTRLWSLPRSKQHKKYSLGLLWCQVSRVSSTLGRSVEESSLKEEVPSESLLVATSAFDGESLSLGLLK